MNSLEVHLNNNHGVTVYSPCILNGEYYIIEGVNFKKPAHSDSILYSDRCV